MIKTDSISIKIWIAVVVLTCATFLMFFRLGYYALWDDEADTALFAISIWRTGDTYAMLDHNLIAHTDGQELKGLRNRYIPPLAFYLAAPFIGLAGQGTTFWARFPFAVCGWLTVAVMLLWLWKGNAPVIPACIFVAVVFIEAITVRLKWLAIPLAILAFGTNVLHGGPLAGVDKEAVFSKVIAQGRFRSTIVEFIGELMSPPPSAYCRTARWIEANIKAKQSAAVLPSYATYPLMYHAPRPLYAWQLKKKTPQFQSLPDIHFYGVTPPQFMIAFGPFLQQAKRWLKKLEANGVDYELAEILDIYWYDLVRPELFWHSFKEVRNFSAKDQAIYIFQRQND